MEEYLASNYRPDRDFLGGKLLERNVGELDHSSLQGALYAYLFQRRKAFGIHVYPELRVQVRHDRFRIPDICVVAGARPTDQVLRNPPLLCIEILSPSDSLDSMQERVDDYLAFGVPYVWLVSPKLRRGWIYTPTAITEAKDGVLRTSNPDIAVPLNEILEQD